MKFYGKITEGKPTIYQVDRYKEFFSTLEEGSEFEIKVQSVKDIRNLAMNNLYWAWLGELSLHSGYTKRELHDYFKQELLCKEIEVNGKGVMDCDSTSELSIKEFAHYLDEVARLAAENFTFVLVKRPL